MPADKLSVLESVMMVVSPGSTGFLLNETVVPAGKLDAVKLMAVENPLREAVCKLADPLFTLHRFTGAGVLNANPAAAGGWMEKLVLDIS